MGKLQKHLIYWILPSVIILSCILIYFYDFFHLSQYIAPELNREFGVVENLQLVILLLISATALKGVKLRSDRFEKNVYKIIFIFSVILFLEEIDYGIHYYEYFVNRRMEVASGGLVVGEKSIRNIHNNWKLTNILKLLAYALIAIFFVVLPLIPKNRLQRHPAINYLAPSKFIITTAISLFFLNQIALYLYSSKPNTNHSLNGNVSEFEEVMIYYIGFLYLRELIYKPTVFSIKEIRERKVFSYFKL